MKLNLIYIAFFIICVFIINAVINLFRYLRITVYYERYKANCNSNKYLENISFYLPVTRMFNIAQTNRIDRRNGDYVSEQLQEEEYESELNICFKKTIAYYKHSIFRPWNFLFREHRSKSKFLNKISPLLKAGLLFLCGQVFASVLDASGIGDILWEMLIKRFPLLDIFLNHISHS